MTREKTPLTILLGAGASVHAGVPSTWELTEYIRNTRFSGTASPSVQVSDPDGHSISSQPIQERTVYETIYWALRSKLQEPNFEHILAVLEDLTGLAISHGNHDIPDYAINVLAPFVVTDSRYPSLGNPDFLRRARSKFIKSITQKVADNDNAGLNKLGPFLLKLQEAYQLSIFTLNYDTLAELPKPDLYYDGFSIAGSTPNYSIFDRKGFIQRYSDERSDGPDLLCHLHGCIEYGFPSPGNSPLVKFTTAQAAIESQKYHKPDISSGGTFISRSPIISGLGKAAKLTYSPIPYGYYFKAFAHRMERCPHLLVIGYGGFDDHINIWLHEFSQIHGDAARTVYVTPRRSSQLYQPSRILETLEKLSGVLIGENQEAVFDDGVSTEEFYKLGQLALCAGGFPLKDENSTTQKIERFLAS